MGKYQVYSSYRESALPWMGKVPSHWIEKKFKRAFVEKKKKLNNDLPAGSISFGEVIRKKEDNLSPETKASYQEVLEGEFLLNPLNLNFDLKSLRTALSEIDVVVSTGYIVLNGDSAFNQRYLRWLLFLFDVAHMKTLGSGVRQTINFPEIGSCEFFHPEHLEQTQIANFLDHETAKIDTLIEKQQQLIKLLKEKRQAVISHAVTKGLNPEAPMKDSGVAWLGEAPEHWGVTRLKYECSEIVDCPHSTPTYSDEGQFPAIRTADIHVGHLDVENARRVTKGVYDQRNFRLTPKAGDIIYSREGERYGIGAIVPDNSKVCLAQRVMLFRAKETPEFLMWAINSRAVYKQAQQDVIGATSPHVNVVTIKNFSLPWPPKEEREEISNYIRSITSSMDELILVAGKKVGLLQERRTALISAAVTGKIDVRNWQAPISQDQALEQTA